MMERQKTHNTSSQDSLFVQHYLHLKRLNAETIDLVKQQRVARSTFTGLKTKLKHFDVLLEGCEPIKAMFRKGKEFNNNLTPEEEQRIKNILEVEANLKFLENFCRELEYHQFDEKDNKQRMLRKYIAIYKMVTNFHGLYSIRTRIFNSLEALISDEEVAEDPGSAMKSSRHAVGEDLDHTEVEKEDCIALKQKLENHLELMIENHFFASDSQRCLDKLQAVEESFEGFSDFKSFVRENSVFKKLNKNALIEVFKHVSDKNKVQIAETAGEDYTEHLLKYDQLSLRKLHVMEAHKEMAFRYQKAFIVTYFGSYYDPSNHGFQLCVREPERTLREVIHAEEAPIEGLLKLSMQVLEAIRFSHENNTPVGDLRPENILVKEGPGNSQIMLFSVLDDIKDNDEYTETAILNRARYSSPELISGLDDLNLNRKTFSGDSYCFGLLVWEIFQKQEPYGKIDSLEELIELKLKNQGPSTVLDTSEDYIAGLEQKKLLETFFENVWNLNPMKRPSMSKLRKKKSALKKIIKSL